MAVSNVIERLGRAIFEAPFGTRKISKDAPELAEIRIEVLDAVKAKSHRASGKSVFPYNLVRVLLLGVPEEQAAVFCSGFLATYFADELRSFFARSNYRYPKDLSVEIATSPTLPEPGQDWLSVEADVITEAAPVETPAAPARLVLLTGTANAVEFLLDKPRVNIGRTLDVSSEAGPSRRNDLVFAEDDIGRSVSRQHAHILRSPGNEYRIFNDRMYKGNENCGIWIVRTGLSQPVHRGARGTALRPDDEIHLGQAILHFKVT
jgi:pSer/pThr/pTyr-binding forkhead associated (FHA) protein